MTTSTPRLSPGQLRRIFDGEGADGAPGADKNVVAFDLNIVEVAVHRIVGQQMGERGWINQVVDRHNLDVSLAFDDGADDARRYGQNR